MASEEAVKLPDVPSSAHHFNRAISSISSQTRDRLMRHKYLLGESLQENPHLVLASLDYFTHNPSELPEIKFGGLEIPEGYCMNSHYELWRDKLLKVEVDRHKWRRGYESYEEAERTFRDEGHLDRWEEFFHFAFQRLICPYAPNCEDAKEDYFRLGEYIRESREGFREHLSRRVADERRHVLS
jgi:hypothetical protein